MTTFRRTARRAGVHARVHVCVRLRAPVHSRAAARFDAVRATGSGRG
ncbi:hypothetical protein [Streptomyces odontomachi]|nr:hypothetical protein [Streptomyces sp. ODS25]